MISTPYRWLIFLCLFLVSLDSFAESPFVDQTAIQLIALYQKNSLQQRVVHYSAGLLGSPYQLGALGEGPAGKYDKNPLYRFDYFDCETYLDTVMAMALAKNFIDFKERINHIRYRQGQIAFIQRNHFPSADWIPNNKRNGYIRELTYTIAGQKTKITTTLINRRNWYQHFTTNSIQIPYLSTPEKSILLAQLKKEGQKFPNEEVSIAYIPLAELLQNSQLERKIPTGSIIFFVGDNNHLTSQIGTQMNVFHMGFAIWKNGQLYFRMASSRERRVIDAPFQDYLKTYLTLDILKGISVWAVTNQKVLRMHDDVRGVPFS
ncbi:MAG: N-acetylmuramoyl-L-alanine amidase-like domain-containing protein [Pseudomonadota bacterium]